MVFAVELKFTLYLFLPLRITAGPAIVPSPRARRGCTPTYGTLRYHPRLPARPYPARYLDAAAKQKESGHSSTLRPEGLSKRAANFNERGRLSCSRLKRKSTVRPD